MLHYTPHIHYTYKHTTHSTHYTLHIQTHHTHHTQTHSTHSTHKHTPHRNTLHTQIHSTNSTHYTHHTQTYYISTTQLLTTSLILPRLDYCNSPFYSLSYKDKLILHKLQNNAIRLIYNLPNYSRQHITPLRKKLH